VVLRFDLRLSELVYGRQHFLPKVKSPRIKDYFCSRIYFAGHKLNGKRHTKSLWVL
jgi:hypothetical protein